MDFTRLCWNRPHCSPFPSDSLQNCVVIGIMCIECVSRCFKGDFVVTESQKTVFISKIVDLELPHPSSKMKLLGGIKDGVADAKAATKMQTREIAEELRRFLADVERRIEE